MGANYRVLAPQVCFGSSSVAQHPAAWREYVKTANVSASRGLRVLLSYAADFAARSLELLDLDLLLRLVCLLLRLALLLHLLDQVARHRLLLLHLRAPLLQPLLLEPLPLRLALCTQRLELGVAQSPRRLHALLLPLLPRRRRRRQPLLRCRSLGQKLEPFRQLATCHRRADRKLDGSRVREAVGEELGRVPPRARPLLRPLLDLAARLLEQQQRRRRAARRWHAPAHAHQLVGQEQLAAVDSDEADGASGGRKLGERRPLLGREARTRPEREGAPLALRAVRLEELHRRDRDDPRLAHARRPLGEVDASARRVHRGEGRLRVRVGEEQDRRAALWRRELEALDRRFSRRQRRGAVQEADAHALGQRALRIVEGRADRVAALDQPRLAREEDLLERRAVAGRE
mmetsp:Transcript_328/g.1058  ORF Transcript_328/g.1058 Transcript_328/m.1058 type:complete len:403 (+) Transcript_328:184-1392(+)